VSLYAESKAVGVATTPFALRRPSIGYGTCNGFLCMAYMNLYIYMILNFNVFAEKEKLKNNWSNFTNWFRNLRIILAGGQKAYVLEEALGDTPARVNSYLNKCFSMKGFRVYNAAKPFLASQFYLNLSATDARGDRVLVL
jgi:hypothetical protein